MLRSGAILHLLFNRVFEDVLAQCQINSKTPEHKVHWPRTSGLAISALIFIPKVVHRLPTCFEAGPESYQQSCLQPHLHQGQTLKRSPYHRSPLETMTPIRDLSLRSPRPSRLSRPRSHRIISSHGLASCKWFASSPSPPYFPRFRRTFTSLPWMMSQR